MQGLFLIQKKKKIQQLWQRCERSWSSCKKGLVIARVGPYTIETQKEKSSAIEKLIKRSENTFYNFLNREIVILEDENTLELGVSKDAQWYHVHSKEIWLTDDQYVWV